MMYEQRPWLAVTPWSQVVGRDGYAWTVLPHHTPAEKRITRKGREVQMFTPGVLDIATVLVPDEADAWAALVDSFGVPEVLGRWQAPDTWWTCPEPQLDTVLAHLRDWHGTMERGTTSHLVSSTTEGLAYHWQVHQQQLVMPLPTPHVHGG